MCLKAISDPPHQNQDDQDQEDQSDSAAGIGSPGLTVAPGGQGADEQDDQDDDQDDSHDFSPFLFFLLLEIISITYFSDPVGQFAITKNKRVYDKIRITSLSFLRESGQGLFFDSNDDQHNSTSKRKATQNG